MTKNVAIKENQSLIDVAVQNTGDIDSLFDILALNEAVGLDAVIVPGTVVVIGPIENNLSTYLLSKKIATDDFGFIPVTLFEGWTESVKFNLNSVSPAFKVGENQSLLDMAVIGLGDLDKVFDILASDSSLGLEGHTDTGTVIELTNERSELSVYLLEQNPATDDFGFIPETIFENWTDAVIFNLNRDSPQFKVKENQSLLDMAAMAYGDPDGVFEILAYDDSLNLEAHTGTGTIIDILYNKTYISEYLMKFGIATDESPIYDPTLNTWILFTNYWNDSGIWIDTANWND